MNKKGNQYYSVNPLVHYAGSRARIANILNYHYEQILREIDLELIDLPTEERHEITNYITDYMESLFNYSKFTGDNLLKLMNDELSK